MGVVVKPTVGVFDLLSKTSEGVQTGAVDLFGLRDNTRNVQVRPKRVFSDHGVLLPYDFSVACGHQILREALEGHYSGKLISWFSIICPHVVI